MNEKELQQMSDDIFCVKYENDTLATWLTGNALERWLPGFVPQDLHYHHKLRYDLACNYVEGKEVLDIACGCGFGSLLLADIGKATSVLGIDIDCDSIRYGSCRFPHPNVRRDSGDALKFTNENKFDAAVSFETIEHLPDVPLFLQNIKRSLNPGAIFLVSTPIVLNTRTQCDNPYHMIEWSFDDFHKVITEYFSIEEVYLQNISLKKNLSTLIYRAIRKIRRDFFNISYSTHFEKWTGQYKSKYIKAGYQTVVCKNSLLNTT